MNRTKLVGVAFCVGYMAVTGGVATASTLVWLTSGKSLTKAESATAHGAIFLETPKNKVECTGLFVGTVGPNAEDLITEVNNLSGGEKDLLKNCKNISGFCNFGEFEVHAIDLPWKTTLELIGEETWDAFVADGKGNPGWELLCALGTNVKCEFKSEKAEFEGNGTNGAKFAYKGKESGEAECSNGEIGVITSNGELEVLGFAVGGVPVLSYVPVGGAKFTKGKPAAITVTLENSGTAGAFVKNIVKAKFYGIKDVNCIGKVIPKQNILGKNGTCSFEVTIAGAPEPNSENVVVELEDEAKMVKLPNMSIPVSNS